MEKALKMMKMLDCKVAPTPMTSEIEVLIEEKDPTLEVDEAKLYRSCSCLLLPSKIIASVLVIVIALAVALVTQCILVTTLLVSKILILSK